MPDNIANITAIVSILVALGTLLVVWRQGRNKPKLDRAQTEKERASTAQLITEAASDAVVILRAQIADLQARIALLEASLKVHTEEIARLRSQIRVLEVENDKLQVENLKLRDRWNLLTGSRRIFATESGLSDPGEDGL